MRICGLKLTHDGAIALIEGNRLIFSIEVEKIENNKRYSELGDTSLIWSVLKDNGYGRSDIDSFVVDGWFGIKDSTVSIVDEQKKATLHVAPYHEENTAQDVLQRSIGESFIHYSSYTHAAGHVMAAYASSPFAQRKDNSFILLWDGGMHPRLYYLDARSSRLRAYGPTYLFLGNVYSVFSQRFSPQFFKKSESDYLSVPGKVMAYISLGVVREDIIKQLEKVYTSHFNPSIDFAETFSNVFENSIRGLDCRDTDLLASFHFFLETKLIAALRSKFQRWNVGPQNLCYAGGCALNIKWNNALRACGLFKEVWIPPFPNDSGSAIGTACCELFTQTGQAALEWNVFSGPKLKSSELPSAWNARECSIPQLALLLHDRGQPVVFLNGSAELGPRALGNRSILAAACRPGMKDLLNQIKNRESYRPVAPICLESKAEIFFDPGCPDPYMLFEHTVRDGWQARGFPIMHLDGSARLQTIAEHQNKTIYDLLVEYEKISGLPFLCNTSANFNGCGFFPDVKSAIRWGKVDQIWSEGILYEKRIVTA